MLRIVKTVCLILLALLMAWIVYEVVTFPRISRLRTQNPETTSMIETRLEEARKEGREPKRFQVWVPLERISPHLQRAVLAGEDTNFATHNGFDYEAIQRAWEEGQKEAAKQAKEEGEEDSASWIPDLSSFKRGGSTISQQLAKNLYLSSERSAARKAREAVITYFLERNLSKRRILEIYLNVIEWGDGIYGAEAAARTYFNKSAADLSPREAAFLSAMIPNPRTVFNPQPTAQNPKSNLKRVQRRQRVILRGMPFVKLPPGTG
ncbi:MAG TPA: biosynthetic peptidoglycan transglycosylase [Pyrinomonadaceae bacterium]|nr:biosynthetic peptidoglycan transglycosylase [Pyrinomonadaceae bacterium]